MSTEQTTTEQSDAARPTMPRDPVNTAAEAISMWQRALELAADMKRDAEIAEAHALIAAYANPELKNDGARKAAATLATAEFWRRSEHAQARAKAAGALVDLLLGGRAR